jgi:putative intracellular protease/amidase
MKKWFLSLTMLATLVSSPSFGKPAERKAILFVLTSHDQLGTTGQKTGAYLAEITHAYELFQAKGYPIDFVSPKGGQIPVTGTDNKDPINAKWMADPTFTQLLANSLKPETIKPERYDAVYYPGGHGTMFDFPDNKVLAHIAARVYEQGGVIGAVCHGPAGLVNITLQQGDYLVKGKKVAAFTNDEEKAVKLVEQMPFLLESKLIERGAIFSTAANFQKHVVVSERLVTGQNPASATGVAEEMLKLLRK